MEQFSELRSYIRNVLLKVRKEQKQQLKKELQQENKLRKVIRKSLYENKKTNNLWTIWPKQKINEVKETAPHESTGINLLAKLLDNIIPVIETGYKNLTTDFQQRASFRAHILKATQNLLATASLYFNDDDTNTKEKAQTQDASSDAEEDQLEEQDTDPKKKMFIDIRKDEKDAEKEAEKDPENAFQDIKGEDTTGRAFALETFKKIQKQTLESYSLLANPEDRKKFYKYLITNLGLYLDQFEDELKTMVQEPTTPEYEAEKAKKEAELEAPTQSEVPAGQTGAGVAAEPAPVA